MGRGPIIHILTFHLQATVSISVLADLSRPSTYAAAAADRSATLSEFYGKVKRQPLKIEDAQIGNLR